MDMERGIYLSLFLCASNCIDRIFSLLKFAKRDSIDIIIEEFFFIDKAKKQKKILTKGIYLCLN